MRTSITFDVADKAAALATTSIAHRLGARSPVLSGDERMVGSITQIARRYAKAIGETEAGDWSRRDLAKFIMGQPHMMSQGLRAANVTTGSFPSFVFLNAITKAVAAGFESSINAVNYRTISSLEEVPDFRQYSIGGLGVSNLPRVAEDEAFPELDKSEGVYNGTVKMWGGTISLTEQALVNDDLRLFESAVRNAGQIAQKTINKRVYQKLLMGTSASETTSTWTSNTTSGASLSYTTADTLVAARANIGKGTIALMNKTGLDGNPLGTIGRYLVAGPTVAGYAMGIAQAVGGQTVGNGYGGELAIVASPWLELATLAGNSTTTYYILADPNSTTGLVVSMISGMTTPQVMPYDAGATAALKWKLWLPFEADLVYESVNGTATIAAAQQMTL